MLIIGIIAGVVVVTLIAGFLSSFFRQPQTVDSGELIPKGISRAEYEKKFALKKSYRITGIKDETRSIIERG